jgi:hypothetical protein
MSLEKAMTETVNTAADVTKTGLKLVEGAVKKAWSVMEAASEKRAPSEYLSQQAMSAMQGKGS